MTTTAGTTTATAASTTNRSDFAWPRLAQRQRIFDWDRYEFRAQRPENTPPQPPQWFRSPETLEPTLYSQRLRFDFEFRPKPILGADQRLQHAERTIEYDRDIAAETTTTRSSRPRVFKCPQISLDDVPADRRDMMCTYVYTTSKTMSDLTSGVPRARPITHVDASSKPFGCGPGKFQPLPLYRTINPPKNWRRISIGWDETQRRIFGGQSTD